MWRCTCGGVGYTATSSRHKKLPASINPHHIPRGLSINQPLYLFDFLSSCPAQIAHRSYSKCLPLLSPTWWPPSPRMTPGAPPPLPITCFPVCHTLLSPRATSLAAWPTGLLRPRSVRTSVPSTTVVSEVCFHLFSFVFTNFLLSVE